MSGLELLRAWADNPDDGRPSIGRLLGMRPVRVDEGFGQLLGGSATRFRQPARNRPRRHLRDASRSVMGCAVHTTLPAGVGPTRRWS